MKVLIMAAGTGGHVFPALSIAEQLTRKGVSVEWLGTPGGLENSLLQNHPYPLHQVRVSGLRGSGISRLLMAPLMLLRAFSQSLTVIRRVSPDCVLGMGGFVCGPAGLAAWITGRPLLVHEQNAVPGLTNRLLAPLARRVLESFPGTFAPGKKIRCTGNPVRESLANLDAVSQRPVSDRSARLLIIGGSLGAQVLNETLPAALALVEREHWRLWHQTGKGRSADTRQRYGEAGVALNSGERVDDFIEDMGEAYSWADLVICRAGASTVSELAAVGKPAILIPYPHHRDQQQLHNANWLVKQGAAVLLQQSELNPESLSALIKQCAVDAQALSELTAKAQTLRGSSAATAVAEQCIEVIRES